MNSTEENLTVIWRFTSYCSPWSKALELETHPTALQHPTNGMYWTIWKPSTLHWPMESLGRYQAAKESDRRPRGYWTRVNTNSQPAKSANEESCWPNRRPYSAGSSHKGPTAKPRELWPWQREIQVDFWRGGSVYWCWDKGALPLTSYVRSSCFLDQVFVSIMSLLLQKHMMERRWEATCFQWNEKESIEDPL